MTLSGIQERTERFSYHLKTLAAERGAAVAFTVLNAEKSRSLGERLLRDALAHRTPDLVVTVATLSTLVARDVLKDSDIPQVFFMVGDPVGAGLIRQIGHPSGTNLVGVVNVVPWAVTLDLVVRLVAGGGGPRPFRFGLIHSTYPSSISARHRLLAAAAERSDSDVIPFEIRQRPMPAETGAMIEDAVAAMATLAPAVDFFWIASGPMGRDRDFMAGVLAAAPKPVIFANNVGTVKAGVLTTLAADLDAQSRQTAILADRVLRGQDPGSLPTRFSAQFRMSINLTTALRMNIVIPSDILEMCRDNLYW